MRLRKIGPPFSAGCLRELRYEGFAFDNVVPMSHVPRGAILHSFVVWPPAALGRYPVDNLVGIGNVARLAVDAVRRR